MSVRKGEKNGKEEEEKNSSKEKCRRKILLTKPLAVKKVNVKRR